MASVLQKQIHLKGIHAFLAREKDLQRTWRRSQSNRAIHAGHSRDHFTLQVQALDPLNRLQWRPYETEPTKFHDIWLGVAIAVSRDGKWRCSSFGDTAHTVGIG